MYVGWTHQAVDSGSGSTLHIAAQPFTKLPHTFGGRSKADERRLFSTDAKVLSLVELLEHFVVVPFGGREGRQIDTCVTYSNELFATDINI